MKPLLKNKIVSLKECRHGHMLYLNTDKYVGRALDEYGEYSEEEIDGLLQLIQPGWTVIEVGANMGALTVPIANCVTSAGRVHAFEPQSKLYQILCANLALNNLDNVLPYRMALGNRSGLITVPEVDYGSEGNFGAVSLAKAADSGQTAIVPLDSLGISAHVLKIDVEGMECEVLEGAKRLIEGCLPIIHVENDRRENSERLIKTLADFNYRVYWHITPLYSPKNYFGSENDLWPGVVTSNLLAIHKSMRQKIDMPEITASLDEWLNTLDEFLKKP